MPRGMRQCAKSYMNDYMLKRARVSDIPPFGLRMRSDLKERIEKEVEESGRSQNAEIVARLEWSFKNNAAFKADSTVAESPVASELEALKDRVAALEKRFEPAPNEATTAEWLRQGYKKHVRESD